jgi:hypothetical protein
MRHAVGGKESPLFHLVGGRKATAVHPEARGCECTPACGLPRMVLCRTNLWVGLEAMVMFTKVSTGVVPVLESEGGAAHGTGARPGDSGGRHKI